jgi:hypothetical protein
LTRTRFWEVEIMFEVQPEEEFFWAVPLVSKRTGWLLGNCFWRAGFEAGFRTEWRGRIGVVV